MLILSNLILQHLYNNNGYDLKGVFKITFFNIYKFSHLIIIIFNIYKLKTCKY